jgi:hypothetical protein
LNNNICKEALPIFTKPDAKSLSIEQRYLQGSTSYFYKDVDLPECHNSPFCSGFTFGIWRSNRTRNRKYHVRTDAVLIGGRPSFRSVFKGSGCSNLSCVLNADLDVNLADDCWESAALMLCGDWESAAKQVNRIFISHHDLASDLSIPYGTPEGSLVSTVS